MPGNEAGPGLMDLGAVLLAPLSLWSIFDSWMLAVNGLLWLAWLVRNIAHLFCSLKSGIAADL
jgi:hypothetical protein